MFRGVSKSITGWREYMSLPSAARAERRKDRRGLAQEDPGIDRAVEEAVAWLGRAQDNSTFHDGGVAHSFSLITGWSPSYPETTGYIVPTMLAYMHVSKNDQARRRAKKMLDWLVSNQFPDGAFQGGPINADPLVPVTFNTGQILLGLADGVREFGMELYHAAMCKASDWLVQTQDADGCWRKHPSPFVAAGEKVYDTHVAWGLLEAARLEPKQAWVDAALANVRWALKYQQDNGWFDKCCLEDPSRPLTHTLGYVLRGIIEAYRFTDDRSFLEAARKTADGLLAAVRDDGFIAGRLDSHWQKVVPWVCLTGSVQISLCWLLLSCYTGEDKYRQAAYAVNSFVRRTMKGDGPLETRGGIKGSFPIDGAYGSYQYLSWACKFFIDANMLEKRIREAKTQSLPLPRSVRLPTGEA